MTVAWLDRRAAVLATLLALLLSACFAVNAWAAADYDGDGYTTNDCAPLDGAIHPGAVDLPDTAFEDSNCDGIDGDAASAVFVATSGSNAATGTKANPLQTITAGIAKAVADHKNSVYVAGGTYSEMVQLVSGVSIYGGYEPLSGARSMSEPTVITASPQAVLADGATGVTLQLLTLKSTADGNRNAYGLRGINGSKLALDTVTTDPGAGGAGAPGGVGTTGNNGTSGNGGSGYVYNTTAGGGAGGGGGNAGGAGGNSYPNSTTGDPGIAGTPGVLGGAAGTRGTAASINAGTGGTGAASTAPGAAGANAAFSTASAGSTWTNGTTGPAVGKSVSSAAPGPAAVAAGAAPGTRTRAAARASTTPAAPAAAAVVAVPAATRVQPAAMAADRSGCTCSTRPSSRPTRP